MVQPWSGAVTLAIVALLAAGTATLAQAALTPFRVTDRAARNLLLAELPSGGRTSENGDIVSVVFRGYDRMPPAARGPATTAIFAWAKAFVSSAEFKTAYEAARSEHKPEAAGDNLPIDEAVEKQLAAQVAAIEQGKSMFAALPEPNRTKALAGLQAQLDSVRSPQNVKMIRSLLEVTRKQNSERHSAAVSEWEARFPADLQIFIKRHLEEFLTVTNDLNYAQPTFIVRGTAGETLGFLSPGYTELPWQKVHAVLAGKDAVMAGRAAAQAWLKEIGR